MVFFFQKNLVHGPDVVTCWRCDIGISQTWQVKLAECGVFKVFFSITYIVSVAARHVALDQVK